jgi:DNA-binding CsgD family transcriptional regulator
MWAELPSPPWVAYCRYRRAEALLGAEHPNRAAAAELIGGAHQIATELGARLLVEDVTALARRARIELRDGASAISPDANPAVQAPATPADPHGLTEREREVLALLVAGRTNREIGEILFISPKTAGVHVSNILGKLGAVNRVEAASVAHRLRLLG